MKIPKWLIPSTCCPRKKGILCYLDHSIYPPEVKQQTPLKGYLLTQVRKPDRLLYTQHFSGASCEQTSGMYFRIESWLFNTDPYNVYYSPYMIGNYNPLSTLNNQVFVIARAEICLESTFRGSKLYRFIYQLAPDYWSSSRGFGNFPGRQGLLQNLGSAKKQPGGENPLEGKGEDLRMEDIFWTNYSDLTRPHPKWWFSKGNPLISGKPRLVKYYNLARYFQAPKISPQKRGSFFFCLGETILRMADVWDNPFRDLPWFCWSQMCFSCKRINFTWCQLSRWVSKHFWELNRVPSAILTVRSLRERTISLSLVLVGSRMRNWQRKCRELLVCGIF